MRENESCVVVRYRLYAVDFHELHCGLRPCAVCTMYIGKTNIAVTAVHGHTIDGRGLSRQSQNGVNPVGRERWYKKHTGNSNVSRVRLRGTYQNSTAAADSKSRSKPLAGDIFATMIAFRFCSGTELVIHPYCATSFAISMETTTQTPKQ